MKAREPADNVRTHKIISDQQYSPLGHSELCHVILTLGGDEYGTGLIVPPDISYEFEN
jgi:hypothetical protein